MFYDDPLTLARTRKPLPTPVSTLKCSPPGSRVDWLVCVMASFLEAAEVLVNEALAVSSLARGFTWVLKQGW